MANLETRSFTSEGTTAVHRLRRALSELIASVNADPSEPQELARRFKLDKTLTWRLSRVIREEDAWEAIPHIPGRPSIRTFVQRLESHGASPESVAHVQQAMEDFERFVALHSGDRDTLEIMAGAGNGPAAAKRMEVFRKHGFQANSAAWGVQARVQFACQFLMPGPKKDTAEMVWAGGFVDLLRLRPDVPWADGGAMSWSGPNSEVAAKIAPLFPEDAVEGVPLIREFCSSPLPRFRTKTALGGIWHFVIADGPFGHTGAVTLARGWRWTETPSIYESTPGECGEHGTLLYTPVELLIQDFLVHRSLTFAHQPPPSASIHSRLPGGPEFPQEGVELTRMPMPEDVVELGSPPSMTAIEIPRYQQLIERVLERLGRTPQEFVGFRHRVRYPTIPTIAVFRHPLLKRPQ